MNRLVLVEVICLAAVILISGSAQALSNLLSADMLAKPATDSVGEFASRQVAENSSKSSSPAVNANTVATVESASRTILVSEEYTAPEHSFNSTFFGDFKPLLLAQGYAVTVTNSTLSPSMLAGVNLLIVSMPRSQYSASEIDAIEQFVSRGGSLFCIADCFDISRVDDLIKKWGFSQANGMVSDSNNYVDTQSWVYYEAARGNFADHPITSGLRRVLSGTSNWLLNPLPNNAVSIITTDNDGTASPSNVSIYAALDTGTGRIVISMDGNFFSHTASGGKVGLAIDDNALLGLNTIAWLTHKRLCDLSITSQDISFSDSGFPGDVLTITAVVHNVGEANAENFQAQFFDGQNLVGESSVSSLSHHSERAVVMNINAESGLHQIRVSVDPENSSPETDEDNNQATRSFLVGAWIRGGITLTGTVNPAVTSLGSQANVTGTAVYSTDYGAGIPVAGADIYVTIGSQEWVTHTIADGTYTVSITAPYSPGNCKLAVMITDYTFWEKIELDLTVGPVIGLDVALGYHDLFFSPASPTKGDQVTITAVVHNVGTEDASNVLVGFYDNYLPIGFNLISALPIGGSQATAIVWQVPSWGWHTITAIVDPYGTLTEANELDNVASKSVYAYPDLPDLTPRDITTPSGTPLVNQGTTITARVANIGGVHALSVVLHFYDNEIFFAERVIPFIAWKGGVEGVSVEYEFTNVGWHELSVLVDPEGAIGEADENNNRLSTLVFVRAPAADLAVSWGDIAFSNPSPADGDLITIYAQVHNIGELDAYNVVVEFVGIDRVTIDHIPSGETRVASVSWAATPAGSQWITVIVDSEHTVPEFNEFNNAASRRIYVDPKGPFPDLSIISGDIAFSNPTPVPSEVVTISATIRNIGDAIAESVPVVFYVNNVQMAPIHMTPRLAPTEDCIISTLWIAFPIGTHEVKVGVDPGYSITEHSRDNNEAYREIYVYPSQPDLTPRHLTLSDSTPATGQAIIISVEVQNLGGTSANNVPVNFYDDDRPINGPIVPWIAGRGGVEGVSVEYEFTTVGWHVLSVVVDLGNTIPEAVETNNDLSILVYVHSPEADLAVSGNDITFSNSHPTDGDQITICVQVHNIGELEAYDIVVEFVGIGQVTIPHIPSGETRIACISWTATPAGFHGILVSVDPSRAIAESNEFNNIAFRSIIVYPPLPPDLLVYSSDIVFSDSNPNPGEAVTIQATVHNVGNGEANDISVTFYLDRGIPIETETVAFIPAGGSQNIATEWIATQPGSHVLTVAVDVVVDSNKNNNVATRAIIVVGGVFLEVPYQNQDGTNWCGPTSLAMILQYYDIDFHSWDYAKLEHLSVNDGTDYDMKDLEEFVNEHYYPQVYAHPREEYTREETELSILNRHPLLLGLHKLQPAPGHVVVALGFNKTGIFINDPSGALFTDVDYLGLDDQYASTTSWNRAYVDWTDIEQFADYLLQVTGVPSPPSGSFWIEDKTGVSFINPDHEHQLQMDRGLQWVSTDGIDDGYVMPAGSYLTIKLHVSNSKAISIGFTCRVYAHEEGDSFELCSESVLREAFCYNDWPIAQPIDYVSCSMLHEELDKHLTNGRKYWLEIDLYDDGSGNLVDDFSTPPFYWETGQTHKLEDKQHHLYLHVYDDKGDHVGLNHTTNQTEIGIPGSYYNDDGNGTTIIVLPKIVNLTIVVDAPQAQNQLESFNLTVTVTTDLGVFSSSYSGNIAAGEIQTFTTEVSDHSVVIIPEFPSFLVLPLFMIATLLVTLIYRRKRTKPAPKHGESF